MASQFLWTSKSVDLLGAEVSGWGWVGGCLDVNVLCWEEEDLEGGCDESDLGQGRIWF